MPIMRMPSYFRNFLSFIEIKRCRKYRVSPKNIFFPVIWVTNRCNLKCMMCNQWKIDPRLLSQELTTQEWYSFVDSVSHMGTLVIVITGGEPLLRPDIFDVIKYIHKKGIASHLCTNGTLLNESTVNRIKDSGLNSVSVSLDSDCAEVHNLMRGMDCFDMVVKGIRLLRHTAPEIKIGINCVISKQNFRNIYRMVPFAERLRVDQIKFDPIHTNLMHRNKNLTSFRQILFNKDDLTELKSEIGKLINMASKSKLLTNSLTFMKGISSRVDGQRQRLLCYAGYISCAIDAFGRLSPCDEFDGEESIRFKRFEDIWNSASFQRLRQRVDNCNSGCWDTTHAEINIRCSNWLAMQEFRKIFKELYFYLR